MIIHFMHEPTGQTPCPTPLLLPLAKEHSFTMDEREVTCPICKESPIYEDALAQSMERTIGGSVWIESFSCPEELAEKYKKKMATEYMRRALAFNLRRKARL